MSEGDTGEEGGEGEGLYVSEVVGGDVSRGEVKECGSYY